MAGSYPVPAMAPPEVHETEQIIRKSRFLAQGSRCASREEARELAAWIRSRYPDATHHCWAYVAGAPGCTANVGSSDDGEPHGTAGRPMLNALLHCGIGQICVVISRWFGGIKLGTGGLARAYGSGAAENAASMRTLLAQTMQCWQLCCAYADLSAVKRVLASLDAAVTEEKYGEVAALCLHVPEDRSAELAASVAEVSGGRARLTLPAKELGCA